MNSDIERVCFIVTIITFALGCNNSNEATNSMWKYSSGYYIGDVISFDSHDYYTLDDRGNIQRSGDSVARIVTYSKKKLVIESFDGKQGIYVFFGHSSKSTESTADHSDSAKKKGD